MKEEMWLKKHLDTVIVMFTMLTSVTGAVLWINHQVNDCIQLIYDNNEKHSITYSCMNDKLSIMFNEMNDKYLAKFNEMNDKYLAKFAEISNKINTIEKDIAIIKTVLIMKEMLPKELAKEEVSKQ